MKTPYYLSSFKSFVFLVLLIAHCCDGEDYYGKLIGKLSELNHGLSGEVYAVDARTLFIKDFNYDGEGPAAYFYAGNSRAPIINGFRIRDEKGNTGPLKQYRKKKITLTLPEGKTLKDIKWFSVYCDAYSVNFGDVRIPRGFDFPKPQKLAGLNGVHGVRSDPVVVVDAQTLLVPSFSYDGEAPDAKFWVGSGAHPSSNGIRLPDENGRESPLRAYDRKTIVLTLPGDITIHQLGHFGIWCEAFTVDFGHIQIPSNLNVPPSLKMLGISPQSKLNCEVLDNNLTFEVRWAVAGESIVIQLVSRLDDNNYMSFGLSANPERSLMVGGDVVVAWVDKETLQGYAIDYILDGKSQCSGKRGSCPDTRIQDSTNSIRLLNAAMVNGYSIITYQRPLKASDELDLEIKTNRSQAIIWGIGPLNERNEVSFHTHYLKSDKLIEFGRPAAWNCPMPETDDDQYEEDFSSLPKKQTSDIQASNTNNNHNRNHNHDHNHRNNNSPRPTEDISSFTNTTGNSNHKQNVEEDIPVKPTTRRPTSRPRTYTATPAPAPTANAWEIPPIQCYEPEDGNFYAQLGPTGGKHGYPAITGHVGWGVSWYINGLLIPEINVVRGREYTFVIEAGDDPDIPAKYHPFYITDDSVGGYMHKNPEERAKVKIFAGVELRGSNLVPTGVGRYCSWVHDPNAPEADSYVSFGAFQRSLTLICEPGTPGFIRWTPDKDTPNTVYYQCFTHRYLGWKINVLDSCDEPEGSASQTHQSYVLPDSQVDESVPTPTKIHVVESITKT
ncbi:DM13 and DOMON_DOH domain-containing protein skeletor isoform X1 [Cotesia typhae]|uniref:DM13 and DOMON_DOH domain-containing protein skeletor isoform X1 n=1 Tax=Cotesia typhae TaxID=2053667 RepID=UPI003D69988B